MSRGIKQLTLEQAIKEGYKYFGVDGREWQHLNFIEDVTQEELESGNIYLFSKETISPSIDSKSIAELIAEHVQINWHDESQDDTDDVYDFIMEVDFTEITDKINKAISSKKARMLTDIQLIKIPNY